MKIRQAKKIRRGMFLNDKVKYSAFQTERASIRILQYMKGCWQLQHLYYTDWDLN